MNKFDTQRFGVALGITWAFGAFLLGLSATFFDYGTVILESISSIYIGYEPTVGGAFIGAIWGFVDAYIGGVIFAWIYNKLTPTKK